MVSSKAENTNKTNSFTSLDNSKTVSYNASTIKYSEKRQSQKRL